MTSATPMDVPGIYNAVLSHAARTGLFETVRGYDSMSTMANGIHFEAWCGPISPIRASGLAATSARVIIIGRIEIGLDRQPRDAIETDLLYATDRMMAEYNGNFTLALGNTPMTNIREVDIFGAYGVALEAKPGYVVQDNHASRICDLTIPIIANDIWAQAS